VNVRPVRRRRERSSFIRLPWTLYRDDPMWVPPLRASVRGLLDVDRHPFYAGGEGAELELFVAWEGRDPVGRVAAILNHAHNRYHDERVTFFGFLESIERPDVVRGLLAAVESWAGEHDTTAVRGPANPSTNYECGLLVDSFTRPPVLMMTYNPPYLPRLVEAAGYAKARDLYAYISPVHDSSLSRLERLADRTRRRHPGLETRGVRIKEFEAEVRLVRDIYNAAWERNWGFVPMTDAEITWLAKELKPLVHPGLTRFAEVDGEPVGFLLCVPDWNPVLADLEGSPLRHPLRTLKHLLTSRPESMEGLRLILLGVRSGYRNRGLEGVLIAEGLRVALDAGYRWCEYSWILEENELTKRLVRLMDGERYKTYRIYEKTL
jgi:GNAT superfamily N-acetyltransferase